MKAIINNSLKFLESEINSLPNTIFLNTLSLRMWKLQGVKIWKKKYLFLTRFFLGSNRDSIFQLRKNSRVLGGTSSPASRESSCVGAPVAPRLYKAGHYIRQSERAHAESDASRNAFIQGCWAPGLRGGVGVELSKLAPCTHTCCTLVRTYRAHY